MYNEGEKMGSQTQAAGFSGSVGAQGAKTGSKNDYKVKDISLADWGRKEILIAERKCRGLWLFARSTVLQSLFAEPGLLAVFT